MGAQSMLMKRSKSVLLLLITAMSYCAFCEELPKVKVNFSAVDMATVARQVERLTKRSFLFDENVLRGKRVTLQSDTPIGPEELYRVFQAVCQMNGLTIVPVEGAGINLEKIVSSQAAMKEPGNQPVLVRGDLLPSGDALISYLIKLKYVTAQRMLTVITPTLSATGSVLQIPNTELLMINDVASSIKRTEKVLALLDTPSEPMATASVRIVFIPAEKAQTMLNEYHQAIAKVKGADATKDRIAILKDERMNVLHLFGAAADVAQAEIFLKTVDVDSPSARRTIRYYKLNNVPVKDIVDYVSELLGVALSARVTLTEQTTTLQPVPNVPGGPPPHLPPPAVNTQTVQTVIAPRAKQKIDKSNLPADIIPVEGLNMLVVGGDASVHQEVEGILANLDTRKGQVLIEVAIVQVTGDDTFDLGVEGIKLQNMAGGDQKLDFGSGFGIGKQADSQTRGFPTESTISGITGAAFRFVKGDNLQILLSTLAGKSNVSIVSQPLLLVNDNEEASFTTKVSEPTITTSQGTATTNTSFSGFADATTSLKIVPHISPDNYLNLEISQTFEEFTGAPAGAGIPPPKVSNNAVTKVSIPDRQTIVIGGFTRDSASASKTGIPGLMQVPGLGKLFSRENKRKTISRLYLFVRPKILATTDFKDLEDESDLKKGDVERLSKKSKLKEEIKEKLGTRAEIIPLDPVVVPATQYIPKPGKK